MTDEALKLGLMVPLSGLVSLYSDEITWAATIACEEVNEQGGVLGRPLALVIEDDGSLPDTAVLAAERLVNSHHCAALVGNLLSNSCLSVMQLVTEPLRVPLLNFSFYEGSIPSRYFFNFAALPNQQIDNMIPYMAQNFGVKMFFAGNNYEWPRGSIDVAKRVLRAVDGEVVGEEYFDIGTEDFDLLLSRVATSGADVFIPYAVGVDQQTLLNRFYEKGLKERMAVVVGHYDEAMARLLRPEVRDELYSINSYFMSVDTPGSRAYLQRLNRRDDVSDIWPNGNGVLTNFGEGAYLCVKAYAAAVNNCASTEREAIIDALEQVELTGPQGKVTMDPETHHATVNCYLATSDSDGRFSIVEQFGSSPPVIPERYRARSDGTHSAAPERFPLATENVGTEGSVSVEKGAADNPVYDNFEMHELISRVDAAILTVSDDGVITYANEAASLQFGYSASELVGFPVHLLVPPQYRKQHREYFRMFMDSSQEKSLMSARGEITAYRKDGSFFPAAASISKFNSTNGSIAVTTVMNLTERKSGEAGLLHLATHDVLTGLPNRVLIRDRLQNAVLRARRADTYLAVLIVDLDRFKLVNDNYGHEIGDLLLSEASERMLSVVRPGDTVGRFGGDEFVVICDQLNEPAVAGHLAERVVSVFEDPIKFEYGELYITASVGLAIYDGDDETAESLLRKADTAMYHSKEKGRDQWQPFREEIGEQVRRQLDVSNGLHSAIDRDELYLHYQPIMDAENRRVVAVEALLRWNGPGGFVSPELFIPIAEMNGSILPIGSWVFSQSCRAVAELIKRYGVEQAPAMSINLSARQLIRDGIVEQFLTEIGTLSVPAEKIILEVTESSLVTDVEINLKNLTALSDAGMQIAVDDFGTGYSSMGQLKRFPVDILKIDRSFVSSIEHNENEYAISAAVIQMSKALGIKVTAEGVETEGQYEMLRGMGCHTIQGYLFSRPRPLAEICRYIAGNLGVVSSVESSADSAEMPPRTVLS